MEINKDDVDNNISQIEQLERQWEEYLRDSLI